MLIVLVDRFDESTVLVVDDITFKFQGRSEFAVLLAKVDWQHLPLLHDLSLRTRI